MCVSIFCDNRVKSNSFADNVLDVNSCKITLFDLFSLVHDDSYIMYSYFANSFMNFEFNDVTNLGKPWNVYNQPQVYITIAAVNMLD